MRREPHRYFFELTDVATNVAALEKICDALLSLNDRARIIVTVSPVPLDTTFSGKDILVANTASKAILRSAAEAVAARHPHVDYFPSFDMVMSASRAHAFRGDCQHVTDETVDEIVSRFLRVYMNRSGDEPGFREGPYLRGNPDVELAVRRGELASGYEHWVRFGREEGRSLGNDGGIVGNRPARPFRAAASEPSERKAPDKGFVICTTPRSGSNLLCEWCASTGKLGNPLEYFNGAGRRALDWPDYPDDVEQQIAAILRIGATANGVYSLKVFPDHFDHSAAYRWAERLPGLRFVHLERGDKLGQALSWARAIQTSQFRKSQPAGGSPSYSRELIQNLLSMLVRWHARWQLYFARNGIDPLRVSYEEIERDPAAVIARIGAMLEVSDLQLDPDRLSIERQRDEMTEA